ncbi:MAG TPA: ATP-binding protein [Candidatus Nitrosotenuis sp.]|nr:ATP-binding protein [Candidatus Nitrosotenuis sp.]
MNNPSKPIHARDSTLQDSKFTWKSMCNKILKIDQSIRFVGISNETGQLIQFAYRKGISQLLSQKEAEWSAFLSAMTIQTRTMFEHKLGRLLYSSSTYEKVKRITISLKGSHLLLMSMERDANVDKILGAISEQFSSDFETAHSQKEPDIDSEIKKTSNFITLGKLTAKIVHEIRSPLAVILNNAELISDLNGSDSNSKQIQRILRGVNRIDLLVNNILDFSKYSNLNKKLVSVGELIDSALSEIIVPDTINMNLPKTNLKIYCDPEKLVSVLKNIIINAIQSMENNGTIKINIKNNKNSIRIDIENSGPPIVSDDLAKVFEPLFTTKVKGVGLGLSISKEIVESHGGNILVKNNPVTFSIVLPTKN